MTALEEGYRQNIDALRAEIRELKGLNIAKNLEQANAAIVGLREKRRAAESAINVALISLHLAKAVTLIAECKTADKDEILGNLGDAIDGLEKYESSASLIGPRIKEAAIMGSQEVPWVGRTHAEIIKDMIRHYEKAPVTGEQGFVTDSGKFVSREEAARIAFATGQIPNKKVALYSEDLSVESKPKFSQCPCCGVAPTEEHKDNCTEMMAFLSQCTCKGSWSAACPVHEKR